MDATTTYTETEATDVAVMLLVRKLRKIDGGAALAEVLRKLDGIDAGLGEALAHAEQRGDRVRWADEAAGLVAFTRPFPSRFAEIDDADYTEA